MATQDNRTPKIRRKSAVILAIPRYRIRERLDAQIFRIFQARAIVQSVRAAVNEQEEGCDSWFALDVVQETLKGIAADLSALDTPEAHHG